MTHDPTLVGFMAGAVSTGFLAISLFFLKFWQRTRERLFLAFAAAFVLLSVGQMVAALLDIPSENLSGVYLLRLAAFLLIIWAVLSKNLERK